MPYHNDSCRFPELYPTKTSASLFTLSRTLYEKIHKWLAQGLLFIGLILGTALAEALCSGRLSDYLVAKLSAVGSRTPEHRLWLYWPAAAATAIGLALFGCSIQFQWHWMVVEVSLAIVAFGIQIGRHF